MALDSHLEILRRFAPGTVLREATELIIRQGTGALIVVGSGAAVDRVCTGGFRLAAAELTAQRIAELAKMDGGIVVDDEGGAIVRANVHFIPDPSITTIETGTRFRTAERLAIETDKPVLAISEEGRSAAIVFSKNERFELQRPTSLLAQANQSLNSLERLRRRLDHAEERLTHSEVDDVVAVREVVVLIQRAALVHRLKEQLDRIAIELGGEAQLIRLQAEDLVEGVDEMTRLVYTDYVKRRPKQPVAVFDLLAHIATPDLYDAPLVAGALKLLPLDAQVHPRGYRVLAQIPRLPDSVKESLVEHFGGFQKLLHATVGDLDQVDGVGRTRAQQLRSFFDRLVEAGQFWDPMD